MALVIVTRGGPADDKWGPRLKPLMPELEMRHWPDVGDPSEVDAVLLWSVPDGLFETLTSLKAVLVTGAGVDTAMGGGKIPPHLPICRLIDPSMTAEMSEYVVMQALRFHRQEAVYAAQQRDKIWKVHPQPHPADRRIGMLGLGELGSDALAKLKPFGFPLAGWSRTQKSLPGIECFSGRDGLDRFLARTDILVNLLPLTADTRNIIDARLLAQLPRGSFLINCARGGHVVDADLLAALDSGHVAGAALDVFHVEPLPTDHPYWSHPKVILTPHSSALTNPTSAGPQIVENLRRIADGRPLLNLVDRSRGY